MPFSLDFWKEHGIYEKKIVEEADISIAGGKNVTARLSEKIRDQLSHTESDSHQGDKSRQDSAVITAMLADHHKPEDVYATFAASARGKAAAERHPYFEDYLSRTIKKAIGFLDKGKSSGTNESISVDFAKKRLTSTAEGLNIVMVKRIEVEKTQWLWNPYLPAGKLVILAGDPGMGKSTIALDLVARISAGRLLPTGERSITGTCLVASAEDAPGDTIAPRLIAAEANLERVGIINGLRIEGEQEYLQFPRDFELLKTAITDKGARLLIIDPLNAFLEKGTDTYKDQDVRRILHPLGDMAEETGCTILIVAHLNKKDEGNTLYRVGGTIGFVGAARSVLAVSNSAKEGIRVLYSLKSNLSKKPPSLAYETRQIRKVKKTPEEWQGPDELTSNGIRWRGVVAFDPSKGAVLEQEKADNGAQKFLMDVLSDGGEIDTDTIYADAKKAGVLRSHLNHVKTKMGVTLKKRRDGKWTWSLPQL